MGRYRRLPEAQSRGPLQGHALRAAINTPIQGSAADVVMMAMIKLWKNEKLKALGWKMLLQIHDEVILEGQNFLQHFFQNILILEVTYQLLFRRLQTNFYRTIYSEFCCLFLNF